MHKFPAIAPLATNNGTFEVLSGDAFATAGDLTNTGTLSVGGSLTVNGNLTEARPPRRPPCSTSRWRPPRHNAAPRLTVTGTTTLRGNLTAEFSGGFAAPAGTAYTVADLSSAAAGAFASTAGVGPDFTVAVNPTSIVLDSTQQAPSDLAVTSVNAPATFTSGQSGTVT